MNLLQETVEDIKRSEHTVEDIIFIGSEESGYYCSWEEFRVLADRDYDNDYGASKVAVDLIIVFADGVKMWRGEYDGREWWEYSTPFQFPQSAKPIKSLFARGTGWESLEDIHSADSSG
jgi:hypothetical protein